MDPRLKSSTKWSPFPEELCELTAQVLNERFSEEYDLEKTQFVVEGRIYQQEIIGRYGLQSEGQLKQANFEISQEFDSEKQKALEVIQNSMDVVEHLWTELLEDDLEDKDLATEWQALPYEKNMYYYRYSTINTSLEQEADKLLEEYEKKLVYQSENHSEPTNSDNDEDKTIH